MPQRSRGFVERAVRGIFSCTPLPQRLSARRAFRRIRRGLSGEAKPLLGIGGGGAQEITRRALVSYITDPLRLSKDDPRFTGHGSYWTMLDMVNALNDFGYVVDAVEYTDTRFTPRSPYDLFIGHGGYNFRRISDALAKEALRVYYSAGAHWAFHNREEERRFEGLRRRRGVSLKPNRLVNPAEADSLNSARAIIGHGNDFTAATYGSEREVHMFPNPLLHERPFDADVKDYDKGRRHFLYFAGWGNVHKGLDLILEAFSARTDLHLWICSEIDPDFAAVYSRELTRTDNIHLLERVSPNQSVYGEVMLRCNWCVLPSCAEGGANSVVQCMSHGLIPVVTPGCGIDTGDWGFMLDAHPTVGHILDTMGRLMELPPDSCRQMGERAHAVAVERHCKRACSEHFRRALRAAIDSFHSTASGGGMTKSAVLGDAGVQGACR